MSVIIIGAGIGGLATSIYLARQGHDVTIFEKNPFAGGRCGAFTVDGHRFDTGATLLMMRDVYETTYSNFGTTLEQELELIRIDPVYQILYHDGKKLLFTSDLAKMRQQLEAIEPGSYYRFLKYMDVGMRAYRLGMKHIINRNYYHFMQFFNLYNLWVLYRVKALQNHYKYAGRYFNDSSLRSAFTFQNIYVGQDPYKASAVFSMLPFLELSEGVWFPKGGMNRVTGNLLEIALKHGVNIEYNSPVRKIITDSGKVKGVELEDGRSIDAGIIVNNADLPYAYTHLLNDKRMKRRMGRMKYACSAYVFHWGVDTIFDSLDQHNVIVAKELRKGLRAIFDGGEMPEDFSFYVHCPAKADATAAPMGQDSVSVIVPVANMDKHEFKDPETMKDKLRHAIFERLKREGIPDIASHIKFEKVFTQQSWENVYNLYHGSTFGSLSHNLLQMGYMRPHNRHRKYGNLYFVGGSTHPGNGAPMALISARLVSERIINGR